MEGLIRLLLVNARDRLSKPVPPGEPPLDLLQLIESQLTLVALGYARFDGDGRFIFVAPDGPEPDRDQMSDIYARIDDALLLVPQAVEWFRRSTRC